MIKYAITAILAFAPNAYSCTDAPPILPPHQQPVCQGRVILLPNIDAPTNCDLTRPQVLAAILDDDQADWDACDHAGGAILHDAAIDRFYCINLDY